MHWSIGMFLGLAVVASVALSSVIVSERASGRDAQVYAYPIAQSGGGDVVVPPANHGITLEAEGVDSADIVSVSGLGEFNEVVRQRIRNQVVSQIVPSPGPSNTDRIVLSRPLSDSMSWDAWYHQVEVGNVSLARKNGSVILYDSSNLLVARWNFVRGWPCRHNIQPIDPETLIVIETIEICHEGMERSQ